MFSKSNLIAYTSYYHITKHHYIIFWSRDNKNFSIYKSIYPLCTHAYVISKSGINKLLKYLETNKVGKIIDHYLGGLYQQGVINSLSFMQTLVDQPWQKSDSNLKLETYNK